MISQKCGFKIVNNNFTVHSFMLLNSIVNDDLRFSNTTGILQKKKLCGLLVLK